MRLLNYPVLSLSTPFLSLFILFTLIFSPLKVLGSPADFDGDGKQDPTVFRPSSGVWYVAPSAGICPTGFSIASNFGNNYYGCQKQWGLSGDIPISGDFDADGKSDLTVYRPSNQNWYIAYSSLATSGGWVSVTWPPSGTTPQDIPDEGDVNGDGRSDIIIFRQRDNAVMDYFVRIWTAQGILRDPIGSFAGVSTPLSPASGLWNPGLLYSGSYPLSYTGFSGIDPTFFIRIPIGSFSRHGFCSGNTIQYQNQWCAGLNSFASFTQSKAAFGNFWPLGPYGYLDDATIFDTSNAVWYTAQNPGVPSSPYPTGIFTLSWGLPGDEPIPGKYFNSAVTNYATWRPSDGTWYIRKESGQTCPPHYQDMAPYPGCKRQWGLNTDIPVK